MKNTVKLFATLTVGRDKIISVNGLPGMICRTIIEELGISEKEVGILLVNGRNAKLNDALSEEDVVSIIPPIGGCIR